MVPRASRVRWRYQRARAWWPRRQFAQCSVSYPRTRVYSQAGGPKQDAIVLAICLSGLRPGIYARTGNARALGCGRPRTVAVISETKPFIGGQSIKREDAGRGAFWCVATDLGIWTIRQDRQVMLMGARTAGTTRVAGFHRQAGERGEWDGSAPRAAP